MPAVTSLSPEEIIADILAFLPEKSQFSKNDNLVQRGLDSLRLMRLLNAWRKKGVKLSFADLIENPTLEAWLKLMNKAEQPVFTTPVAPEKSAFPLTDIQYAYWIGRRDDQPLGGVGCHAYLELDGENVDPMRLQEAWRGLLRKHPMLRACFLEDGRQQILPEPYENSFAVNDLRETSTEQELLNIRQRLSHRRLDVEKGHVAGLEISLLPDNRSRIHFDIDLLVADAQSLRIILDDLADMYQDMKPVGPVRDGAFANYIASENMRKKETEAVDRAYWQNRLASLPGAPALPLRKQPTDITRPFFTRRTRLISSQQWKALEKKAASAGVTPALVLLGCYAQTIARWSENRHFLLNLPLYNRFAAEVNDLQTMVADFTNLVLLEIDLGIPQSFLKSIQDIGSRLYRDMAHSGWSGVRVLRDLAKLRPDEHISAPVVFAGSIGARLQGHQNVVLGTPGWMITQTPQVWLDFQIYETDNGILAAWDLVEELFQPQGPESMFAYFNALLDQVCAPAADWNREYDPFLVPGNRTTPPLTAQPRSSLHLPFFEKAAENPDAIAIIAETGEKFTRGDLARAALAIAQILKNNNVPAGSLVAVTIPRGPLQIAAAFGILACGCAYAPVSIDQPRERRARIHARAGIRHVLTLATHANEIVWPKDATLLFVDTAYWPDIPTANTPWLNPPEMLAYVIFTSGSTGEPKGVEISHTAAALTLSALTEKFGICEKDRVLAVSALDFDLSVFDIFGILGSGGSIVTISENSRRNPYIWQELARTYKITIWNSVPVLLDMLLTAQEGGGYLQSLRLALLSGDWIGLDLPSRLANAASHCRFAALGGATEAAIWSNIQEVRLPLPDHWRSIPYGKALPGHCYRVVDSAGRDCPDWVVGELWIGGPGLARGYRGDPEITARSFVFQNGRRWYRTGDLGRFWPDGTIEFLGRRDFQVKIRGHRIELGEIENAIRKYPDVRSAAVLNVHAGGGASALRAFVAPENCKKFDLQSLREFLFGLLPAYMQPASFTILANLPMNANGKLDRKVLEAIPEPEQTEDETCRRPQTSVELTLATIWKNLLDRQEILLTDSFFELGGDSLLATRLAAEVKKNFGIPLALDRIFLQPAFSDLANHIAISRKAQKDAPILEALPQAQIDKCAWGEPFPLTAIQHAYWIGRTGAYNLGNLASHIFFEFDNVPMEPELLRRAWHKLAVRHPMLRAVCLADGSQKILDEPSNQGFAILNFTGLTPEQTEQEFATLRRRMSRQILPAATGPLYDIVFVRHIRNGQPSVRLFMDLDALIADAWSYFLLLEEWRQLYDDPQTILPEIALSFRDYVLAEKKLAGSPAHKKDWDYWQRRLDALPMPPELPFILNPADIRIPVTKRRHAVLPPHIWNSLKQHARSHGLSPSAIILAAYAEVVGMWSRSSHFILNLTLFNRLPLHPHVERMVGDFTALDLLEVEHTRESFLNKAKKIQHQIWLDLDHRLVSGVDILRELGKQGRKPGPAVVFTSALGIGSGRDASILAKFGDLVAGITQTPQVCLDHQVYEQNGSLVLNWDAVEELFPAGMLDAMFDVYHTLLENLVNPFFWEKIEPCGLPEEQAAMRASFNETSFPSDNITLDRIFIDSLAKYGDKIALISQKQKLTYNELGETAWQAAKILLSGEMAPNRLVAVVMEKGCQQICAVCGIILAGCAYLPVDPSIPPKRLKLLFAESGAKCVLTTPDLKDAFTWPQDMRVCTLQDPVQAAQSAERHTVPSDIAYIIYTSGSTGKPKGVVIEHQAVVNTILDMNERFSITSSDIFFGLSGLHFDLSAYDIWGAFAAGATLVLPESASLRDPSAWLDLAERHAVTIWNSVPALMQMLVEYVAGQHAQVKCPLRLSLLSGDWIPLDLPEKIRSVWPECQIVSLGGATEASIWSILFPIEKVDENWRSIPYGYPMRNQTFHVLDNHLRPRPDWVPGELYIGGRGLAREYWRDEVRTRAAFVYTPTLGRLYRTGDTGRFLPGGVIEFLGREDSQIKLHGNRIELGEIETVSKLHPAVKEAVAVVAGDTAENRRIVLFVISSQNPVSDTLGDFLKERLAPYMLPANICQLDRLPLSTNGKVDRKSLAEMAISGSSTQKRPVLPGNNMEKLVGRIWQEILETELPGVEDNFFDIGGTSLLAVRLHQKLSGEFGRPFPLVSVFEHPTIRAFARFAACGGDGDQIDERVMRRQARHVARQKAKHGREDANNG